MQWHDLLFMHWPVPARALRPLIPAGLQLDTYENEAWLGVVPFYMTRVRPRFIPPIPGLSAFAELNVRTYVSAGNKPGVWFFSLDAANKLAVRAARWGFHLPYFDAKMQVKRGAEVRYRSTRTHRNAPSAKLVMRYRPTAEVYHSKAGTLDHFLTHRLCLYSADKRGNVYRGDIHHARWPLQPAQAEIQTNCMTDQIDLKLPDTPPFLHFAKRLDVVAWRIQALGKAAH
jgi:uncharacterized protein YqjF (DUF2071 family)